MNGRRRIVRRVLVWGIVFVLLPLFAEAAGRLGGTALNLGVGARAEAMGGAFVGLADDASAIYWNPGGIGLVDGSQFSGMHTEWLGGVRYEWAGLVQPVGKWASLGVSGKFLTGGDVPYTVRTAGGGYEERGTFRYSTRHVQFALGSGALGRFRVGGGLEIVREALDLSGASVDLPSGEANFNLLHLGGIYRTPVEGLRVGAALRNLGGSVTLFDESAPVPRLFQIGIGYKRRVETVSEEDIPAEITDANLAATQAKANLLALALDLRFMRETKPALRAGAEYRFRNGFAIRAGYRSDTPFDFVSRLSGGLGYATESYEVDYAFVPVGDLGNAHRVSFTLLFR